MAKEEETVEQRIQRLKGQIKETKGVRAESAFRKKLKKIGMYALPFVVAGGLLTGVLAKDFLLKRQNYPERNVLFRSSNITYVAGSGSEKGSDEFDRESITKVYEGGSSSKVGTYLFETTRETRGDIGYFNMDNSQKIRVASATKKPEIVQAGMGFTGSFNFREEFAEIVVDSGSKLPQKYTVYKFIPERGINEKEVSIIEQEDGVRVMGNRLTDVRSIGLGWLFGRNFRAGTFLEDYSVSNQTAKDELLNKIKLLDNTQTENRAEREKVIRDILDFERGIEKRIIYKSFEDGIIDLLPQESSIYLAHDPSLLERAAHFLGFGRHDVPRLRVENHWDLWPGNYPVLNQVKFGKGSNIMIPFGKYNNGGYTLEDKFGEVARIDINDFFLYYGQDVLYSYFLDLNGDGKIDESSELIGQVLQRTTRDEKVVGDDRLEGEKAGDVTKTANYAFMAPSSDIERGMKLFNLCGYLESFIPDQIHRGFGKHSLLGLINEQRSDIMLYRDLNIENMSRALSQESALVADHDIVNVLIAAKRPYAKDIAEAYGIAGDFEGRFGYEISPDLKERLEIGPIPGTLLVGGLIGALYYRRRRQKLLKESEEKSSIPENTND